MKAEALKLADESQRQSSLVYLVADEPIAKQMSQMFLNYFAMIRRLVEELDNNKLRNSDNPFAKALRNAEALKIKPLSDEEIEECYWGDGYPDNPRHPKEFARAIEERHGIK